VSLHGTACHVELHGNFAVVAALQQQIGNLLFPKAQLDGLFLHANPPGDKIITHTVKGSFAQIPCCKRPSPPNHEKELHSNLSWSTEIHSIHAAKQTGFPQQNPVEVSTGKRSVKRACGSRETPIPAR
jgi:hypothetical protein